MLSKIISLITSIIMFVAPAADFPAANVDTESFKTNYTCVFVHGLGGWGNYDPQYRVFPYWGLLGGDLIKYLNARGFNTAAASVDPTGSNWDRTCELYAQLTGTRVDYGKAHSEKCGHKRYGKNYEGSALIEKWDSENKINLFGHSFGGAAIVELAQLMSKGSEEEMKVTPENEISPLFIGGKGDYIYSITTLAAPLNGTSAYYIKDEINSDPYADFDERTVTAAVGALTQPKTDGRDEKDCAGYDLSIDGAMEISETWDTFDNIYYFSFACDATEVDKSGTRTIDKKDLEMIYRGAGPRIVNWTGTTPKGYKVDESWQANDGLVNTISAIAPFNAPRCDFNKNSTKPGIWNVMPIYKGDHMSLQGGLLKTNNVRLLYIEHLTMINNL